MDMILVYIGGQFCLHMTLSVCLIECWFTQEYLSALQRFICMHGLKVCWELYMSMRNI